MCPLKRLHNKLGEIKHSRIKFSRAKLSQGFSLVEAIVALSILGFGLAMVLQSVALSSRAAARGEQAMHAAFLMQNLLSACGTRYDIRTGAFHSGQSDGFEWSIRMEEAADVSGAAKLVRAIDIHIDVQWQDGVRQRSVRAFTSRTTTVRSS
ncbi:MAG: prepilin-type N-terminal cleavage/methylation domain-containing protein [Gammaproteobacteria bacterium]|nr:prepilin-type N-terminal cleavage/methylation domain-containing protein [Gammaproteobacteria bacterium]